MSNLETTIAQAESNLAKIRHTITLLPPDQQASVLGRCTSLIAQARDFSHVEILAYAYASADLVVRHFKAKNIKSEKR